MTGFQSDLGLFAQDGACCSSHMGLCCWGNPCPPAPSADNPKRLPKTSPRAGRAATLVASRAFVCLSLCGQFIMAGTSNVLLMEVYYRALSEGSTVCRDAAPTRIRPSPSGPIAEAAGGCWGGRVARMCLCSFGGDCFQQPGLFLSTITINKASERVFIFPLQIFSSSCFLPVHTADWGALQQGGPRSRLLLPPHHRSCPCSHSCSCSCS